MLKIENLTFAHPGQTKPYIYQLSMSPGKITTISGPSGSGKSTLLDLIAGFISPVSGSIELNRENLLALAPQNRPISILFQADNLFDHLSVKANLKLGLPPKSTDKTQKIMAALDEVELTDLINKPVSDLSGGQKQRIALARTLLRNQPVVLLDEPFANLDIKTADKMRVLVRQLTTRHKWHTLIVSHLTEDAKDFADKIYHQNA